MLGTKSTSWDKRKIKNKKKLSYGYFGTHATKHNWNMAPEYQDDASGTEAVTRIGI